jgi:hypothetical protein
MDKEIYSEENGYEVTLAEKLDLVTMKAKELLSDKDSILEELDKNNVANCSIYVESLRCEIKIINEED